MPCPPARAVPCTRAAGEQPKRNHFSKKNVLSARTCYRIVLCTSLFPVCLSALSCVENLSCGRRQRKQWCHGEVLDDICQKAEDGGALKRRRHSGAVKCVRLHVPGTCSRPRRQRWRQKTKHNTTHIYPILLLPCLYCAAERKTLPIDFEEGFLGRGRGGGGGVRLPLQSIRTRFTLGYLPSLNFLTANVSYSAVCSA